MAKLLPLACVLVLAGCAQSSDELTRAERQPVMVDHFEHYQAQLADPALNAIRTKVNLTESRHNHVGACGTAAGENYPTASEKQAIQSWSKSRATYVSYLKEMEPLSVAVKKDTIAELEHHYFRTLLTAADEMSKNIEDLQSGQINYCQFSQREEAINGAAMKIASEDQSNISEAILADQRSHLGGSNDIKSIPVSLCYGECPRPR